MKRSIVILKVMAAFFVLSVGFAALNFDAVEGLIGLTLAAPFVLASIETSDEAKHKRSKIWDQMNELVQKRKEEKRAFTEEEQEQYDQHKADFDALTGRIAELEADEKRALIMAGKEARKQEQNKESRELNKYSLKRVLQMFNDNKPLDGLEGEMHQEAAKEARDSGIALEGNLGIPTQILDVLVKRSMSVGGQTTDPGDQGGMLVPTETSALIMALRPRLQLSQLGANMMGGLVGNLDFVKGTSTVASWNTETGTAAASDVATSKITMSPKRLAASSTIYKQLMIQTPENIERKVMGDLLDAVAQAVEQAAIAGTGESNQPTGIINADDVNTVVGHVTDGAAPNWNHIVKLEAAVEIANALMGRLAYLTNAKVKSKLKRTKLDDGSGLFVWPQNENVLNGYPVGVSNLVPSNLEKAGNDVSDLSAIIFGDWSELMIGQWGGLDLLIDPFTGAKNNRIEIVTNSFWDIATTYPEKFAVMLDAITEPSGD